MGVPGLWDILRPAGKQRSLTHLAVVDGFEENSNGRRGLRIGIDASIWFYHAAYGKEGENPELRTLFFRCARLMGKPFLPLFVFDGPKRPNVKRGKRIGGKDHWLTTGMQRIIEAFGFEWRMAPGEAEAELAYLNRAGIIDAIVSDDVDNFLFGASMIIRNPSKTLSGNRGHPMKNAAGKEDDEHVITYSSADFLTHPDIQLTVGGLILIGLLRGGDYHQEGLPGCGPTIAHGLARCGLGDTLLDAVRTLPRDELPDFLVNWRHEVRQELRTNSRGFLGSKRVKLASSLPEDFPDIDVLLSYTNPITSESEGRGGRISYTWNREPDLGRLAGICELFFEWGVKDIIVKRFRTVIWAPILLRILRRSVLDEDERQNRKEGETIFSTPRKNKTVIKYPGTPSSMITKHFSSLKISSPNRNDEDGEDGEDGEDEEKLIVKIHSKRAHASTDGVPEYRLEIAPAQLVRLTEAGVKGVRPPIENGEALSDDECDDDDEGGTSKSKRKGVKNPPPEPSSHLRVWMPASVVAIVEPELVEEFEGVRGEKEMKKKAAEERRKEKEAGGGKAKAKKRTVGKAIEKVKASKRVLDEETEAEEEEEEESGEDFSEVFGLKSTAGKSKAIASSSLKTTTKAKVASKPRAKSTTKKSYASASANRNSDDESGEDFSDVFGISKSRSSNTSKGKGKVGYRFPVIQEQSEEEEELPGPSEPKKPGVTSKSKLKSKDVSSTKSKSNSTNSSMSSATSSRTSSRVGSIIDFVDRHTASRSGSASIQGSSSRNSQVSEPRDAGSSSAALAVSSSSRVAPFPISLSYMESNEEVSSNRRTEASTRSSQPTTPKKSRKKPSLSDSDLSHYQLSPSPKKSPRKNRAHTSPASRPPVTRTYEDEEDETDLELDIAKMVRPLNIAKARGAKQKIVPMEEEESEDVFGEGDEKRPVSPSPSRVRTLKPGRDRSSVLSNGLSRPSHSANLSTKSTAPRNDSKQPSKVTYVEISSDSDVASQRIQPQAKKATNTTTHTQTQTQKALTERTNKKTLLEYMPVQKARLTCKPSMKANDEKKNEDMGVIDLT